MRRKEDDEVIDAVLDEMVVTDDGQYRFHCPSCRKLIVVDKLDVQCPLCGAKLDFEQAQESKLKHADRSSKFHTEFSEIGSRRGHPSEGN